MVIYTICIGVNDCYINSSKGRLMKKISFTLIFNCVSFIVIAVGLYCHFEYENSFSAKRIQVMEELRFVSTASLEDVAGKDTEYLDKEIMRSSDLSKFSKIKSIQDNKYEYLIYEDRAWDGYLFVIIFKTLQSKIESFSVIALDCDNNTMLLSIKIKQDRDILGMLPALLDEILIKK